MPQTPLTLSSPITAAPGIGPTRAEEFLNLHIKTLENLLFYLPRDYLHYTPEGPINNIHPGDLATIRGILLQTRLIRKKPRRFEALLEDASGPEAGRCVLTWFNAYGLESKLKPGMSIRVTGKVTSFRERLQLVQPQWEILEDDNPLAAEITARIEPVYPATEKLPSPLIARIIAPLLDPLIPLIDEFFPTAFLETRGFLTRRDALRFLHQPHSIKQAITAKRSLAYHEFFLHQAAMAIKRYHARNNLQAIPLRVDDPVDQRIRALLPFSLTPAQNRVIDSIRKDITSTKPMNRLLQGDVGSGKTVVALYAMLAATATRLETRNAKLETFQGHQSALMAPTEILAEQHFTTISNLLEGKKVKLALLTGSITGPDRHRIQKGLEDGSIHLVIGTHALLTESVRFKSLALVIIDEQHKFGVEQRSAIRTKPAADSGPPTAPHMLVMTATPIPRTLAMTEFGDLDVSVIDELPPGRTPVFTRTTPASNREEVYKWVATKLKDKAQAFVVVPAIDDSELELRTVTGVKEELEKEWLKDFRVAFIHGRMPQQTRQHIMERFRQNLIDVLVSTTVIEVGVDIPNATIMVVEHADRFGLSQLHQLRGRVGRAADKRQSYCILLGDQTTDDGIARLQAMVKHSSGFKIAEEDLKLRGMGHLIGTAQSGRTDLHFADLLFDPHLLPMSRRDAFELIAADPRLLDPAHAGLRHAILQRYKDSITLAGVG